VISIASMINKNSVVLKKNQFGFIAKMVNAFWRSGVSSADKKFRVNENCSQCGLCVKVCPVENITLDSKTPEWMHRCQECLACVHHCPEQAIEVRKRNTARTGQYIHPEITVREIIDQKKYSG